MVTDRVDLRNYVVVSIWFGCNNDCTLCMLDGFRDTLPPIGFDRFREVAAGIRDQGVFENLILSGAEVTTFDSLARYVAFAASLGYFKKIQVQTNGRRLADREYLRELVECGVNEFFVSVHGTERVHDGIARRPGAYRETMKGIRNLCEFDVNVISNTVMTAANIHNIEGLMAVLSAEPISEFHLWNFFPMGVKDPFDLLVDLDAVVQLVPRLQNMLGPEKRPLVLKGFPHCLPAAQGVFFDSWFPVTVLPTAFWKEFDQSHFGGCYHRDRCADASCWGLSGAYRAHFGEEMERLHPLTEKSMGKSLSDAFEYAEPNDFFYNYCLWRYQPRMPTAGKFRSVNLLRHSFAVQDVGRPMYDLVDALRRGIGVGNTVWGVKMACGEISWEYYFYDYRRRERERSLSRVLEVIRPLARTRVIPNENIHYFMFSLDINEQLIQNGWEIDVVHLYIGNPGSAVSSGICYAQTENGAQLENLYYFFHPADQMDDIVAKILCSAQIDDVRIPLGAILWPELKDCTTICCANKQHCDCIYFSGITVDQFLFFLREMKYPDSIVLFVEQHRDRLDHLLFDVGIDYRLENGQLVMLKSGYYGTF